MARYMRAMPGRVLVDPQTGREYGPGDSVEVNSEVGRRLAKANRTGIRYTDRPPAAAPAPHPRETTRGFEAATSRGTARVERDRDVHSTPPANPVVPEPDDEDDPVRSLFIDRQSGDDGLEDDIE